MDLTNSLHNGSTTNAPPLLQIEVASSLCQETNSRAIQTWPTAPPNQKTGSALQMGRTTPQNEAASYSTMEMLKTGCKLMKHFGPVYAVIGFLIPCFCINKNYLVLLEKFKTLRCKTRDIKNKICFEKHFGKRQKCEVKNWGSQVNDLLKDVECLQDIAKTGRCFSWLREAKHIVDLSQRADELLHEGKSLEDRGLVVNFVPRKVEKMPAAELIGSSHNEIAESIFTSLKNGVFGPFGLYGMKGSGKTEIMKNIYNRLSEGDIYKPVWVVVPENFSIKNFQDNIARAIKLSFSGYEDETIRSSILHNKLSQGSSCKFMLFLDGVTNEFFLEPVGIPVPNGGFSFILTARRLETCRRMGCLEIKRLDLLQEDEAIQLFRCVATSGARLEPGVEDKVIEVARRSTCVPYMIKEIAIKMKGVVGEPEWSVALEELDRSTGALFSVKEDIMKQLLSSFICLEDQVVKDCLMQFASVTQNPEFEREELIKTWITGGLFEKMDEMGAKLKGHTVLNVLENSCLIESIAGSGQSNHVKINDLVRDMVNRFIHRKRRGRRTSGRIAKRMRF